MKNAFSHRNRHSVIDLFRPPAGYRLASAIGTSFSVDCISLTSIMLAFADADLDEDQKYNIPQQLFAFTRLTEKMKLFVNRSCILLSGVRESSRICAIYDDLIDEVTIPNGSFHPKVWLLGYTPKITPENVGREQLFRIVCGSRNLTMSNCWELAVQLDGTLVSRKHSNSVGNSLAGYFRKISKSTGTRSDVLDLAIEQLPYIQFAPPQGINSCRLDFQWPAEQSLASLIPSSGQRAVIISPFLGKTLIELITKRFEKTVLISSRREIELKLDEELVTKLQPNLFYVNDDLTADVAMRLNLHAKLYFFDSGDQHKMMLGSANASRNAWQGFNAEAMMTFPLSIDQSNFLRDFVYDPKRGNGLQPWIERYELEDWANREEESEAEIVDNLIKDAQQTLAKFRFALSYSHNENTLVLTPIDQSVLNDLRSHLESGLDIGAIPISLIEADNEQQWSNNQLVNAFPKGITYQATIARVTRFICFRIYHRVSNTGRTIVLKPSRDNFGDFIADRNKELMRAELSAKQFAQFLAAILFDGKHPAHKAITDILSGKRTRLTSHGQSYFDVLIEDVMSACTEDESRIAEVTRVLETFDGVDADGNSYVDEGFRQFWSEFKKAFDDAAIGSKWPN